MVAAQSAARTARDNGASTEIGGGSALLVTVVPWVSASEMPNRNETPTATGYTGFVNALSTGLARLSQSIAEEVAATQPGCCTQASQIPFGALSGALS
ncbi:MAG: hypothetical protein WBN08_01830 [Thiogranum sp.]